MGKAAMTVMTESNTAEAVLAGERAEVRRAVELVGKILLGSVSERPTLQGFLHSNLGKSGSDVVCDSRGLSSIGHITVGLVLADLIDRFDPAIGPGDDDQPPTWGHVKIGADELAAPSALSLYFGIGTLASAPVVVRLCEYYPAACQLHGLDFIDCAAIVVLAGPVRASTHRLRSPRPARRPSPQGRHAGAAGEGGIAGDDHHGLDHRLRGEHAVEGVTMAPVHASGEQRVVFGHREPIDAQTIEVLGVGAQKNVGLRQFPQTTFRGDLPCRHRGDDES